MYSSAARAVGAPRRRREAANEPCPVATVFIKSVFSFSIRLRSFRVVTESRKVADWSQAAILSNYMRREKSRDNRNVGTTNGGFSALLGYSSRSDLNRCLLALAFATLTFSMIAHVSSFFGIVLIPNRSWQQWVSWGLALALILLVVRAKRLARHWIRAVPRFWAATLIIIWINAFAYFLLSPIGGHDGPLPWPGALPLLHINDSDLGQFYARQSSAAHLAVGLTLFIILWLERGYPTASADSHSAPKP